MVDDHLAAASRNPSRQVSMTETSDTNRIERSALLALTTDLLCAAGMEPEKSAVVAEILVEGDMIGHQTHGVGLIPWYLDALAKGELKGSGTPEIISDRGACFTWDGGHLPGAWLLREALDLSCERVAQFGVVTGAISNCHHTCALAAYLPRVTERGYIAEITTSNPAGSRMAPFGGTEPLLTPNPIAFGFPTSSDPVLVDISSSITTTTMTGTLARRGERYPAAWALTADGVPTDDPREVVSRKGSLMPLGGEMKGNKGYGLALIVELLSQGLSGHGRADAPASISQSVFLQVIDPEAFAGRDAFVRQSTHLADACRANRPAPGVSAVRVPGDSAATKRRQALTDGVPILAALVENLRQRALALGVSMPIPNPKI